MARIEDHFARLVGGRLFTQLGMKSGLPATPPF